MDERDTGGERAAGRNEVIDEHDALPGCHVAQVHLDAVLAVLQLVAGADGLACMEAGARMCHILAVSSAACL